MLPCILAAFNDEEDKTAELHVGIVGIVDVSD
jgi:hypothetical protein